MKKIIFILASAALLVTAAACSVALSTANITKATMTSALGDDGVPVDSVTSYPQDAPAFVVAGMLNNAPDDTTVTFVWYYEGEEADRVRVDANGASGVYVYSTFVPNPGALWPAGKYRAEIYIDEREKPDAALEFTVE